jgi:diguanylate cyclase (GGDEF)-like protein/PAS domain S-box-containing protein
MVWREKVHPDDKILLELHEKALLSGNSKEIEYRILRGNGEITWVRAHCTPTMNHLKEITNINSIIIEITEQKNVEEQYKKLQESYKKIIDMSPVGIVISQNEKITYVNEATQKILDVESADKLINKSLFEIVNFECHELVKSNIELFEKNEEHNDLKHCELLKSDGTTTFMDVISSKVVHMNEPSILAMLIDVTEKRKTEEKIKQLAYYDTLTGLPNRNMLDSFFKELSEKSKCKDRNMGIIFLDLDRFKIINDTMGHLFGDIVLQKCVKKLKKSIGENDMVCRYGGDEFIILLNNTNKVKITQTAEQIIEEFTNELTIRGQQVYVSASLGISMYPKDGKNLETLIKCADTAMYCVKDNGKNNYEFYDTDQGDDVSRKMHLENELRRAIKNNEFLLHYQPQINFNSGKTVGVEALIRWNHPEKGLIYPSEFIPLSEETDLIIHIGKWVLKTACKQNIIWQEAGFNPIVVAVNISARQFQSEGFVDMIKGILKDTKLEAKYLELEITESIVQDIDKLMIVINKIKELGVRLALDDFGIGYSSLDILRNLPIDTLKIDKSFVDGITIESDSESMVKTIIDIGENLKLNVIAEGMVKKEQVEFLKENKCNFGQGYYYSHPLPADEIMKFL